MITLTYKDINSTDFISTMRQLSGVKGLGIKTAYTIAKVMVKMEQEMKVAGELYTKLIKKYAKLDDKGELIPQTKTLSEKDQADKQVPIPGTFQILPNQEEAFVKEADEFMAISFQLGYNAIPLVELEGSGLSAMQLHIISPIINPLELVK